MPEPELRSEQGYGLYAGLAVIILVWLQFVLAKIVGAYCTSDLLRRMVARF